MSECFVAQEYWDKIHKIHSKKIRCGQINDLVDSLKKKNKIILVRKSNGRSYKTIK